MADNIAKHNKQGADIMILIVGGACQGKTEYAWKLAVQSAESDGGPGKNENTAPDRDTFLAQAADGMRDRWEQAQGKVWILNLHGFVRKVLEAGAEPERLVSLILEQPPEIITLDEVGSGIVPLNREDRDYRDAVGYVGQLLASEAQQVYRVIYGIPVRIK